MTKFVFARLYVSLCDCVFEGLYLSLLHYLFLFCFLFPYVFVWLYVSLSILDYLWPSVSFVTMCVLWILSKYSIIWLCVTIFIFVWPSMSSWPSMSLCDSISLWLGYLLVSLCDYLYFYKFNTLVPFFYFLRNNNKDFQPNISISKHHLTFLWPTTKLSFLFFCTTSSLADWAFPAGLKLQVLIIFSQDFIRAQWYKSFYNHNLRIHNKLQCMSFPAFPAKSNICEWGRSPPERSTFQVLHTTKGSCPYPQVLD